MSVRGFLSNVLLRNPLTVRANSSSNQFVGATVLGSGIATVVVSTTAVKSNSIIFLTTQALTNPASGAGRPIEIKTIVDGSYFVIGNADGYGILSRASTIFWMIVQR